MRQRIVLTTNLTQYVAQSRRRILSYSTTYF